MDSIVGPGNKVGQVHFSFRVGKDLRKETNRRILIRVTEDIGRGTNRRVYTVHR